MPAVGRAGPAASATAVIVLSLWPARARAREAAAAEACSLLGDLHAEPIEGGPMSDRPGITWIQVPRPRLPEAIDRLPWLGYTSGAHVLLDADDARSGDLQVRWRRQFYAVREVYRGDADWFEQRSPARRAFLLEGSDSVVRRIVGYRGGPGPLERRALPMHDARLLVNLVQSPASGLLLDPFAGAGSIVEAARHRGWSVTSVDIDPRLRHGLAELANEHVVGDACALPFADGWFDGVATEPPYHVSADATVISALNELRRVLKPGARAAMLVAGRQAEPMLKQAHAIGFAAESNLTIDRKGTEVAALVLRR